MKYDPFVLFLTSYSFLLKVKLFSTLWLKKHAYRGLILKILRGFPGTPLSAEGYFHSIPKPPGKRTLPLVMLRALLRLETALITTNKLTFYTVTAPPPYNRCGNPACFSRKKSNPSNTIRKCSSISAHLFL